MKIMASAPDRQLALAHAAIEHAIYFLEIEAHQQATPHLEFASRQVWAMAQYWAQHPKSTL